MMQSSTRAHLQNNYLYRMAAAVLGIWGNSEEEAIYPPYFVDADGEKLDGANKYVLRFAPGEDKKPNWLPAPDGPFASTMRLYRPKAEALDGTLHEQVYDMLCSDDRAVNDQHRCDKPVGNTVDLEKATYTNSIGDALMLAYWQDSAFDPKQRAFYHVRVLEIPTPRWTAYDAFRMGAEVPEGSPMETQGRAYTSPIWYSPAKK